MTTFVDRIVYDISKILFSSNFPLRIRFSANKIINLEKDFIPKLKNKINKNIIQYTTFEHLHGNKITFFFSLPKFVKNISKDCLWVCIDEEYYINDKIPSSDLIEPLNYCRYEDIHKLYENDKHLILKKIENVDS